MTSVWHQIGSWFTSKDSWLGNGPNDPGALRLLGQHASIAAESLAVAAVVAIPAGLLLARARRGGIAVTSLANAARAIPILGVLELLALGTLGVGRNTAVVALTVFAIPPMLTNTFTGVRGVDVDVRRAAEGMGMTRRQVLLRVDAPLAVPLIATGVRLAAVQVWATTTLAAIVGSGGLGLLLTTGFDTSDYGAIYGGVVIIVVTSILIDLALAAVQRSLSRRYGGGAAPTHRRRGARPATATEPPSLATATTG